MIDRRSMLKFSGASAVGALALAAVDEGTASAFATEGGGGWYPTHVPLPNPAVTPVPNPPFPRGLTRTERRNLEKFDDLDFNVFTHEQWDRLGESHTQNIRVHMPDGNFTDGIDAHLTNIKALFVWAPDTRIQEHPIRIAKNDLTAVTGVMRGTFTQPMTLPSGATVPPNGKAFALNLTTIGNWNRRGLMNEEWLFWDNFSFFQQLGLA